ncbi:hypothetical protein Tco_1319890 [Tanacetum coccineum]
MGGVLEKDPAPHLTARQEQAVQIWVCLTISWEWLTPGQVQAWVVVQKGDEQVKLLDSIKHCFVSLGIPVVAQQEGGSGSGAGPEVSASVAEENVVSVEGEYCFGLVLSWI